MKVNIPEEYQESFSRLMKSAPPEIRRNSKIQKTAAMYLTLGGEMLARRYIELSQTDFPDGSELFDYAPIVEPDTESEDSSSEDNDESE